MPVNTNTLFHFTNSIDNLRNILTYNFAPRLSMEDISFIAHSKLPKKVALPMVCFCDIPLHLVKDHMKEYGSYGIGLTKQWGIKNKLNPVIYLEKNSFIKDVILRTREHLDRSFLVDQNRFEEYNLLWSLFSSIKPYEGISRKTKKRKVFYDEREWRYIPNVYNVRERFHEIPILYENEVKKNKERIDLLLQERVPLIFEPSDIKYLVVKNESEIETVIEMIDTVKSKKFDYKQLQILKTKILPADYMMDDF